LTEWLHWLFSVFVKILGIRTEWLVVGIVLLVGLLFAAFTQHAWEDYWITFRASRNLAAGNGLVYTPGERLHTFTSPLGVLLPAFLSWITNIQSDLAVLWLFRLASIAALAAGIMLLFRTLETIQQNRVAVWLTVALIGLDSKIIDFSINGMEIGLLIFFLAFAIHGLLVAGPCQALRIGIAWAGLMWTRPDSCIYILVMGLGVLIFSPSKAGGESRAGLVKTLLAAGLICAVLYLPWFLEAWSYYGSPVPHTIVAKAANKRAFSGSGLFWSFLQFPITLIKTPLASSVSSTFLPPYAGIGGWPNALVWFWGRFGAMLALVWLIPGLRWQTRFFSLGFFCGNFYLTRVLFYFPPWYSPTVAFFGYLTLGMLFDEWLCLSSKLKDGLNNPKRRVLTSLLRKLPVFFAR
jgi:hypothetical protein